MPLGGGASGEAAGRASVSLTGLELSERGSTVPPVMVDGHPGRGPAPEGLAALSSAPRALGRRVACSDRNVLSLIVAYAE